MWRPRRQIQTVGGVGTGITRAHIRAPRIPSQFEPYRREIWPPVVRYSDGGFREVSPRRLRFSASAGDGIGYTTRYCPKDTTRNPEEPFFVGPDPLIFLPKQPMGLADEKNKSPGQKLSFSRPTKPPCQPPSFISSSLRHLCGCQPLKQGHLL